MKKGIDVIKVLWYSETEVPSMFINGHLFTKQAIYNDRRYNVCEICNILWNGGNVNFTKPNINNCLTAEVIHGKIRFFEQMPKCDDIVIRDIIQ